MNYCEWAKEYKADAEKCFSLTKQFSERAKHTRSYGEKRELNEKAEYYFLLGKSLTMTAIIVLLVLIVLLKD